LRRDKNLPLTETTYYILLSLIEPAHGYLILQKVDELSNGSVKMAAGTLYGAIENLLKLKFIQSVPSSDSRRKVYQVTESGMEILKLDMTRMQHMLHITKEMLKKEADDEEA